MLAAGVDGVMGKGGKGERAGGGRRRRRGGGGRSPCRCLCDDFAPLRSFMSRKRKGVFRQGLDVSKDGLLSGATGRSEEVQRLGCELGGEEPWEGCPCHLWGPRGHRGT